MRLATTMGALLVSLAAVPALADEPEPPFPSGPDTSPAGFLDGIPGRQMHVEKASWLDNPAHQWRMRKGGGITMAAGLAPLALGAWLVGDASVNEEAMERDYEECEETSDEGGFMMGCSNSHDSMMTFGTIFLVIGGGVEVAGITVLSVSFAGAQSP
ncbi:MAG: hypothetical protein PHU25_22155, partial [Deltaproteobacteria bacterium]|nr:hypothetical protein [Deltaproteobacteria bacterium]